MNPRPGHLWTRRAFVKTTATAAGLGLGLAASGLPAAAASRTRRHPLVDVNVNLSRWPLRRIPGDTPEALVAKLRAHGVTQAWAGSFDGLLHKDLAAVNARLAEDCRRCGNGLLLPFGSINPTAPDWHNELQRCARQHGMRGVRLHPNYHGYTLDDPGFERLLRAATDLKLVVQLALVMEDERMMHPRLRVDPVDPAPLAALVARTPGLRLVLLNALRTLQEPGRSALLRTGTVWVDIAMLEGVGGLETLLVHVPIESVLFGSHAPLFYFEAARLKLQESLLTPAQARALGTKNAARVLVDRPRLWQ